jgi:hypothetical protein
VASECGVNSFYRQQTVSRTDILNNKVRMECLMDTIVNALRSLRVHRKAGEGGVSETYDLDIANVFSVCREIFGRVVDL